jgi:ribokinase
MGLPQRYDAVIGTGGLGSGLFLALEGDHTLGREESRAAILLDQEDRCKLHNILYYVQKLLGPRIAVIPIGRVGDDDPGRLVLGEIAQDGFRVEHVHTTPGSPTLFSVCFTYPNGDGGNLTVSSSASALVSPEDVTAARGAFAAHAGRGIALAAPEVPLATRRKLLELGAEFGFLRVLALVSGELNQALNDGLFTLADVVSLNLDEAAAVAEIPPDVVRPEPEEIAGRAVDRLRRENPDLNVVVTAGAQGSWAAGGRQLIHTVAAADTVVNTAGAGDAHLGGLVIGLAAGCDIAAANRFATVISVQKVSALDTIHRGISVQSTLQTAARLGIELPDGLVDVLTGSAPAVRS